MKNIRKLALLVVAVTLLAITTQAMAGPAAIAPAKQTPGVRATERADRLSTQQARAQSKGHGPHSIFRGVISSADATSLAVTLDNGSTAAFALTADSKIRFPGSKGATGTDLLPGQRVIVFASDDGSGGWIANSLAVIPGKPTKEHHVGVVTEYTAGVSITILAHDGQSNTYLISPDTKILPKDRADELAVCSLVTVIFPRNKTGADTIAAGIVVHPADVRPAAFDFTGCAPVGTETPAGSETVTTTETASATETGMPTETPTSTPTETATPTP